MDFGDPLINLNTPIDVSNLTSEKPFEMHINFEDVEADNNIDVYDDDILDTFDYACNITDDDTYDCNPIAFEDLAKEMTNIDKKGHIKKRILRKGKGEVVPAKAMVFLSYNAHLDMCPIPFDTTTSHKKQFSVRLGVGSLVEGLEIGVSTMLPYEKAQFLVSPQLAYGPLGCAPLIPPNSRILFEVELVRFLDSAAADELEADQDNEKNDFNAVYEKAQAMCVNANELVKSKRNYKAAIYVYNQAVAKFQNLMFKDFEEEKKKDLLLVRLHTNLAVCYMKIEKPKKCCLSCNEVFKIAQTYNEISVPAKVYYNNARALVDLGDLDRAEKALRKAASIKQHDTDIVKLFLKIRKLKESEEELNTELGKALVSSKSE